jgi:hypothetical protein
VAEGLTATDVAKEAHRHAHERTRGERLGILEAVLLSIVTLTVAWSGYSAAKWQTEATLSLSQASSKHVKATEQFDNAQTVRAQDISNFNAWFSAYLVGNKVGQRVAEHRFRARYDVAFQAWIASRQAAERRGRCPLRRGSGRLAPCR